MALTWTCEDCGIPTVDSEVHVVNGMSHCPQCGYAYLNDPVEKEEDI